MSEENEGKEENAGKSGSLGSDEFEFYFSFTKPLVLELPSSEDKAVAAAWVQKLEVEPASEEAKQQRLNYLKLLLFVLQRGRLSGIFKKQPPSGSLQPLPQGLSILDVGSLMLDQDDSQTCGGGDARRVPYAIEISNDLREFVASQEVPNFGIQMYYAWSSDEPIHKWTCFDEEKFPQYIIDKIKQIKEIRSDEKSSLTKDVCGNKKRGCEVTLPEKLSKKKVKTPQEIERSQGRSFHAYMGLMGRMGNFSDKCDEDPVMCFQAPSQGRVKPSSRNVQLLCPEIRGEAQDTPAEEGFEDTAACLNGAIRTFCASARSCLQQSCPENRPAGAPQPYMDPQAPDRICQKRGRRNEADTADRGGDFPGAFQGPHGEEHYFEEQGAATLPQNRSPVIATSTPKYPRSRCQPEGNSGGFSEPRRICVCTSPPCTCPCPKATVENASHMPPPTSAAVPLGGRPEDTVRGLGAGAVVPGAQGNWMTDGMDLAAARGAICADIGAGPPQPKVIHCHDTENVLPRAQVKPWEAKAHPGGGGPSSCCPPFKQITKTVTAASYKKIDVPSSGAPFQIPDVVSTTSHETYAGMRALQTQETYYHPQSAKNAMGGFGVGLSQPLGMPPLDDLVPKDAFNMMACQQGREPQPEQPQPLKLQRLRELCRKQAQQQEQAQQRLQQQCIQQEQAQQRLQQQCIRQEQAQQRLQQQCIQQEQAQQRLQQQCIQQEQAQQRLQQQCIRQEQAQQRLQQQCIRQEQIQQRTPQQCLQQGQQIQQRLQQQYVQQEQLVQQRTPQQFIQQQQQIRSRSPQQCIQPEVQQLSTQQRFQQGQQVQQRTPQQCLPQQQQTRPRSPQQFVQQQQQMRPQSPQQQQVRPRTPQQCIQQEQMQQRTQQQCIRQQQQQQRPRSPQACIHQEQVQQRTPQQCLQQQQQQMRPRSPQQQQVRPQSPQQCVQQEQVRPRSPQQCIQQEQVQQGTFAREPPHCIRQQQQARPRSPQQCTQEQQVRPRTPQQCIQPRQVRPRSPQSSRPQEQLQVGQQAQAQGVDYVQQPCPQNFLQLEDDGAVAGPSNVQGDAFKRLPTQTSGRRIWSACCQGKSPADPKFAGRQATGFPTGQPDADGVPFSQDNKCACESKHGAIKRIPREGGFPPGTVQSQSQGPTQPRRKHISEGPRTVCPQQPSAAAQICPQEADFVDLPGAPPTGGNFVGQEAQRPPSPRTQYANWLAGRTRTDGFTEGEGDAEGARGPQTFPKECPPKNVPPTDRRRPAVNADRESGQHVSGASQAEWSDFTEPEDRSYVVSEIDWWNVPSQSTRTGEDACTDVTQVEGASPAVNANQETGAQGQQASGASQAEWSDFTEPEDRSYVVSEIDWWNVPSQSTRTGEDACTDVTPVEGASPSVNAPQESRTQGPTPGPVEDGCRDVVPVVQQTGAVSDNQNRRIQSPGQGTLEGEWREMVPAVRQTGVVSDNQNRRTQGPAPETVEGEWTEMVPAVRQTGVVSGNQSRRTQMPGPGTVEGEWTEMVPAVRQTGVVSGNQSRRTQMPGPGTVEGEWTEMVPAVRQTGVVSGNQNRRTQGPTPGIVEGEWVDMAPVVRQTGAVSGNQSRRAPRPGTGRTADDWTDMASSDHRSGAVSGSHCPSNQQQESRTADDWTNMGTSDHSSAPVSDDRCRSNQQQDRSRRVEDELPVLRLGDLSNFVENAVQSRRTGRQRCRGSRDPRVNVLSKNLGGHTNQNRKTQGPSPRVCYPANVGQNEMAQRVENAWGGGTPNSGAQSLFKSEGGTPKPPTSWPERTVTEYLPVETQPPRRPLYNTPVCTFNEADDTFREVLAGPDALNRDLDINPYINRSIECQKKSAARRMCSSAIDGLGYELGESFGDSLSAIDDAEDTMVPSNSTYNIPNFNFCGDVENAATVIDAANANECAEVKAENDGGVYLNDLPQRNFLSMFGSNAASNRNDTPIVGMNQGQAANPNNEQGVRLNEAPMPNLAGVLASDLNDPTCDNSDDFQTM